MRSLLGGRRMRRARTLWTASLPLVSSWSHLVSWLTGDLGRPSQNCYRDQHNNELGLDFNNTLFLTVVDDSI